MADAPQSLDDQLQAQRVQLEARIQELETELMRTKEGYLKVIGAQEFSAIVKQQANVSGEDESSDGVADPE
jgi:hypothetical protein